MMKKYKKIISIVLIVLLLIGCSSKKDNRDGTYYVNELKNYKVKEKNKNNTIDNEDFEKFLDDIFIDLVSESYLYMHSNVKDYHALNIEKPEVTLGEVEYFEKADPKDYIEQLEELKKFDYNTLSYKQQYDYDLFEYSLLETIASAFYEKYDLLFSRGSDVLNNIVVSFDEFSLYDKESIEDYLVLVKDVDRYLNDCLKYTKAQADTGLYLTKSSIDYSIEYIDSFISKVDNNSLIISFNNRLKDVNFISESEKNKYIEENAKAIKEEVIPSFVKVKEELLKYESKASDKDLPLCAIDINYAELEFMINTSMNKPIDDIFNMTQEALDDMIAAFNSACYDQKVIEEYDTINNSKQYGGFGLEDEETLKYLENHLGMKFAILEDASYKVSRLDSSSASDNTIAYYVSPPLDNLDLNVIRTNPNAMGSDIVYDYLVLAHEGFPGHLYQNIYFQRTNPNRFRATQSFIGYTEGYAMYVESESLDFSEIENPGTSDIYRYFYLAEYLIDSIIDMGVNYYGWSEKDVKKYLKNEGFNEEAAISLYEAALDRAGVLDRYGVGYSMFHTLQIDAKNKLNDKYSDREFNEILISHGPLPFCILEDAVNKYIDDTK